MPEPTPAVAILDNVSKQFDDTQALDGINLAIQPGKLTALLGRNGAGKTTAIRMLLGLINSDSGAVSVLGGDPRNVTIRRRIGAMLQHTELPEQLTVREQLTLFCSYYPAGTPISDLAEQTQVTQVLDRRYGKLSGGQKRRVLFAASLVGDPDFLLLDEPTTGLDIDSRRVLWQLVRDRVAMGKTILLTTHYLEEADALADEVVVIDEGRVIRRGSPDEIKQAAGNRVIRCKTALSKNHLIQLDGVTEVRMAGRFWEIHTECPEGTLRNLLHKDADVSDLTVTESRLEDAFMQLTTTSEAA